MINNFLLLLHLYLYFFCRSKSLEMLRNILNLLVNQITAQNCFPSQWNDEKIIVYTTPKMKELVDDAVPLYPDSRVLSLG